jgi:ribosomal protein S12 methylthiotransferase
VRTKRALRVHVVTMGCAKNVVDSEKLLAQLKLGGVEVASDIRRADVAVINTCGFIEAAKQESVDAIIDHVRLKSRGRLKKIFAMGCLTERYMEELQKEIPEVDRFFGSHQMAEVVRELGAEYRSDLVGERVLTTPAHTAFLKISEGCDNPCSFCAIPLMRGRHASRSVTEILDEARKLADGGVKEVVVIGQDTTYYGLDTMGKRLLPELLQRIADVPGLEWIRLMYAYPAKFPIELLEVIASHPRICKYLDLPVQHIADPVLKSMRRGISGRALRELISGIRERVPGIALRTTLIVGYPSEGEKDFQELERFVEETRFERLGVFSYSLEEGTTAYPLGDPVAADEKDRRLRRIMEIQQRISSVRNASLIGQQLKVLIDRKDKDLFVGRSEFDAPDIDNEVFVHADRALGIGTFHQVEIVDAYEYDIVGNVVRSALGGP